MFDATTLDHEFLRPMVNGWVAKLQAAEESRKDWREVADECLLFLGRSANAMINPEWGRKFWKGKKTPKFKFTINKAFEYIAIYGPNLFWDTPYRQVNPKRPCELPPELFGTPEAYQQVQQIYQQENAKDKAVASLLSMWLNYTPHEQPEGGLVEHSMLGVTDALVEGRGVLWTELYQMPGSDRILTGCFREDPRNLLVDPDFNSFRKAKWIAKRKVLPVWEAERKYKLPHGSLSNRATLESYWQYGELAGRTAADMHRAAGTTNDLIVTYEIYSRMGPGVRRTEVPDLIKDHLEEMVGDYAYIVVCPSCPYPLNMSTERIKGGASEEEVKRAFRWPAPFWRDARWPAVVLDLYPDTKNAWPQPPLAAGLGELKFLNAMIPWAANRIWSSSRDFWAVAQGHLNDLEKYLNEGDDQCTIPLRGGDDVRKILQVMQQPETRFDVWRIIDMVSALFDKRVGLTDFMYGQSDTQDRSAETTKSRMQMIGIRPDYMRLQVKKWQSEAAAQEALLACMFVNSQSTQELLGPIGSMLWDQLVASSDLERIMRQFSYEVDASSIRRPDKDKMAENAQQMMQVMGPIADEHATITGDTSTLNVLIKKFADSIEFDAEGLEFGPRQPQPNPAEEQAMQQQQQMEQAKLEGEMQLKQMDMQAKQMDIQAKAVDMQGKQATIQSQLAGKQADAAMKAQNSRLGMIMDAMQHKQSVEQDAQKHQQDMGQDQANFLREMMQDAATHRQKLAESKEASKAKVAATRAQAKARPSNGKAKAGAK